MQRGLFLACIILGTEAMLAAQAQAPNRPKDYTAHVVGSSHIDLAWLWRWEESIHEVMYNTFRNQLELMNRYPDFTYAQDQAAVYDMLEHYYPDIYKGILQRVKTHNWIPLSSSWVQMDENMPDGESLVRQFLYGQKYSKEKFGRYVRVAWQPDAFGHPYSLPQIARKAGIEFFLFNRPRDPERPPFLWWQGLDGTRLLGCDARGWYNKPIDSQHFTEWGVKIAERARVKDIMVLFGTGDHGGGPNPTEVAAMAALNASPDGMQVKFGQVEDFFDLVLAETKDFPVVTGEMNPVFEGCYTTQVEAKRNNRRAEQLLLAAEKMSELATFFGYRDYYPVWDITQAWKTTMLNQFHDILDGSSIGPVYGDSAKQYQEVFERAHRALNFSLESIARRLETRGDGIPLVVYNSQSWDRTDLVVAEILAPNVPDRMVATHGGERAPVQVLKRRKREDNYDLVKIAFVAQKVPQMGVKLYRIIPVPAGQAGPASAMRAGIRPRPYLENEFLRVEFNPETGNIARLYDKQNKWEAFRREGNYLVALEDTEEAAKKGQGQRDRGPGHAWDTGLTGAKWDLDKAASIEVLESGPVRATIRIVRRFRNSDFTQNVSLSAGLSRVDIEMGTNWYERNTFLKAGFPVGLSSEKVATEIPYGAIERNQDGLEMVMGKWVDISDTEKGVAILNNGRHGYDAKDNVIRISAIRGSIYPDPRADEGFHSFGYAIYPHRGGWREGKVVFEALAFNSPLTSLQEPAHHRPLNPRTGDPGGLPDAYSFIKTGSNHVVLYAMKQMEGFYDREAIVRFYETEGRAGEVTIQLPFRVRALETDLLEETIGSFGESDTIRFLMKPWEIKTLRLLRLK